MSYQVDIAVMSHPLRQDYVEQMLLPRLPQDTPVTWDVEQRGSWFNRKEAASCVLGASGSHLLILQDDVYPCLDFQAAVNAATAYYPDLPYSVFYGSWDRGRNQSYRYQARTQPVSWLKVDFMMGQGIVFPKRLWMQCRDWVDANHDPANEEFWADQPAAYGRKNGDDYRISRWLRFKEISAVATVPSLIEHLGKPDQTLTGRNYTAERKAAVYIGGNRSGLDVDWSRGVLT